MITYAEEVRLENRCDRAEFLIRQIQDALGTAEEGEALVEVARCAHRAEQELAAYLQVDEEEDT